MKSNSPLLLLAATGVSALVLPPEAITQERKDQLSRDDSASWWEAIVPSTDKIKSALNSGQEALNAGLDGLSATLDDLSYGIEQGLNAQDDVLAVGHHHHKHQEKTLYELISTSNYTKKFAALIDEHEDIVKLLNNTSAENHTVFAPIDAAFEHIPQDKYPSKEFVHDLLKYHIGAGSYPVSRILKINTVPTILNEKMLGDEAQRLRIGLGLSGVNVNFYSTVVAANIEAKNGVIHGIRSILVPPPMIGRILTLFPSEFSTLLLAYEKTDFVKYVHGVKMTGSTVFAPSNRAFEYLGPAANAFLFNTEKGLKYLKALLKYHIAPDATLYSDAFYDKTHDPKSAGWKREHYDLRTLLGEAHVGVDTASFAGFTTIRVNGFANVPIRDAPGKNGVIQVVDKVLIPPRKHGEDESAGEMSVDDLVARLSAFVEDGDKETTYGLEL